MPTKQSKRLRMFAGPNGSGKSSIIWNLAKERSAMGLFWLNHYLNADDVERALVSTGLDLGRFNVEVSLIDICDALRQGGRLPDDHPFFSTARLDGSVLRAPKGNGYLAAAIVDFIREKIMERGESFSFETVMSHRSKVDFLSRAIANHYKTYLYFVCTSTVELNVARVRSRAQNGGHDVQESKIRERYVRSLQLVREAISHTYRAYFFDNSGREPIWLAEFDPQHKCHLKVSPNNLPAWFNNWVWSVT